MISNAWFTVNYFHVSFGKQDSIQTAIHLVNQVENIPIDENLNSPGAHFVPLAFEQQHALPDLAAKPGTAAPNRFYMYGVVARLALLAASVELEKTDPNPEEY